MATNHLQFLEDIKKLKKTPPPAVICTNCGYYGQSQSNRSGNGALEIILYLFFIIPGLIYTIWRSSSLYSSCPQCHMQSVVPITTPRGQKLLEEHKITPDMIQTQTQEDEKKEKKQKMIKLLLALVGVIILIALTSR